MVIRKKILIGCIKWIDNFPRGLGFWSVVGSEGRSNFDDKDYAFIWLNNTFDPEKLFYPPDNNYKGIYLILGILEEKFDVKNS